MKRGAILCLSREDVARLLAPALVLPADCRVMAVQGDPTGAVLKVKLWGPGLPTVEEGAPYEQIGPQWRE